MLFIAMGTEPTGPDLMELALHEAWQALGIGFMGEACWLRPQVYGAGTGTSIWHLVWEPHGQHIHAWDLV